MTDIGKPFPNDTPNVTLTIRMIMNGKEVGSIIGKGGEIINNIRETSNAKIHISDGSVPERIVTVTGATDAIFKSFSMICKKFEDDGSRDGVPKPPVTLRLIVPASQCGSLIGKGGSKIKEIREVTGASIQVASEMLPNSTERAVTISGTKEAITQCIYHVCCVMLESPPKGTTIPYHPKVGLLSSSSGRGGHGRGGGPPDNALGSLLALGLGGSSSALMAIASLASSQLRDNSSSGRGRDHHEGRGSSSSSSSSQTYEMSIPNDLIGCIIGKGGSKIAEIRQISGAMIRISKSDDSNDSNEGGSSSSSKERLITISGNVDSVTLAKSLINISLDLHKSNLESRDSDRDRDRDHGPSRNSGSANYGLGLAQLLAKPETLTALTSLASLTSLGSLGGGLLGGLGALGGGGGGQGQGQVTGVHRQRGGYGGGGGGSGGGSTGGSAGGGGGGGSGGGGSRGSNRDNRDDDRRETKRTKFAPY